MAEVIKVLLPQVRDIRRGGSAAIDLADVGCGRLDAYYERGLNPWDLAMRRSLRPGGGRAHRRAAGRTRLRRADGGRAPGLFEPLQTLLDKAGAWHD